MHRELGLDGERWVKSMGFDLESVWLTEQPRGTQSSVGEKAGAGICFQNACYDWSSGTRSSVGQFRLRSFQFPVHSTL